MRLKHPVRIVTAASLFDGHDAAIHIMRRILQAEGAEVIHLGHNRSAKEVVDAAIQEDAQGIALSSYQGGHVEYFSYIIELLRKQNYTHVKVFGGGGGVIVPEEIELLHSRGVTKIFSPNDGLKLGLVGMIQEVLKACDYDQTIYYKNKLAQDLTKIELGKKFNSKTSNQTKILGFTGTGGAGKSSLIDEIILRFLQTFENKKIGVLSVDPTKKKTGGALLGDRIRMNTASSDRVFIRSMATRRSNLATSAAVKDSLSCMQNSGQFDLIILETAGIGQSGSEVCDLADLSVYVMTPEFGAASQLEKIDMLDFADVVIVNKFDKRGALDALRDVRKTYQRNNKLFDKSPKDMPVFGTSAHRFNDLGTNTAFNKLFNLLGWDFNQLPEGDAEISSLIPGNRTRYLAEISEKITGYHEETKGLAEKARIAEACDTARAGIPEFSNENIRDLDHQSLSQIENFKSLQDTYKRDTQSYQVRKREIKVENFSTSLSHLKIPKVSLPNISHWDDIIKFTRSENIPGEFPFTAGVFPFKRQGEDPTRMFAGEGNAERTNKRFHYVSKGQAAKRLSTAFDSATLYGADPDKRPDIYGKIGNAGVSICSLDDAKRLFSGFDLCAPTTSVSMTINGPAPTILAFYFNAAIDAEIERKLKADGTWEKNNLEQKIKHYFETRNLEQPVYRSNKNHKLPKGNDGMGLGFLGVCSEHFVDKELYEHTKKEVLSKLRGTVQADILKEDQAQNTCIFSTEFAMKLMGDVQEFFSLNNVRNFYSISISGYHIAEAGATPVTQLAFTLANGFTVVEYYKARGMNIDHFAHNLSFFFSNGLDPEYAVLGRVARRIWAIAMRDLYGANDRSQKLKYHIQTSGRSLHAQEIDFNDIRTTLQALYAITDNCNSLHTNAYDEAITTPTESSVRRAIAIQMIINHELGLTKNENALQGSYFMTHLTDLVEQAVLKEFESIDARGGVLGAMETMYQRSKIQEESMEYEHKKFSGELPIMGVNTFKDPNHLDSSADSNNQPIELIRSTDEEKDGQVEQVNYLKKLYSQEQKQALINLKTKALNNQNIFEELLETTKMCTLGMISDALYEVGGAYRRSM